MLEILQSYDLTSAQWMVAVLCGVLVGLAKTGLGAAGMLTVPLMAGIFGGKPSAGILLPMLCMADVFGVSWYHRHAEWKYIRRLMPWTMAGILLGLFVGAEISDNQFKAVIALIILFGMPLIVWRERKGDDLQVPDYRWFSAVTGLVGGFSTMIGNAAGPVLALYLISMRLPKNSYIGTSAWFFMIVNLLKVPLHVFFWHTITPRTLVFDLSLLPAIVAGAFLGVTVVVYIPEKPYRIFIMAATTLAALKLFW